MDSGWEDSWDNFIGPQAKAHHLLKGLDLGGAGSAPRQAGQIIFEQFGGSPGNSYTWVELHDDLTVSFPRARLIEPTCRSRSRSEHKTERPTAALLAKCPHCV